MLVENRSNSSVEEAKILNNRHESTRYSLRGATRGVDQSEYEVRDFYSDVLSDERATTEDRAAAREFLEMLNGGNFEDYVYGTDQ